MTGEHKPQRRDKRYRTQLPVRTRIGGRLHSLVTEDVSFRGLFLCTEVPPPVRQLIRMEMVLPPNNIPFATHGMVVYVIGKDDPNGRAAGIGVQFYGMGDERRTWETFIQFIQSRSDQVPDRRSGQVEALPRSKVPTGPPPVAEPDAPEPAAAPAAPAAGEQVEAFPARRETRPVTVQPALLLPAPLAVAPPGDEILRVAIGSGTRENRRFHRFPIVLEVWPRNVDELLRMYTRDVSVGGMFLPTAREIPVAMELRLDVRHPRGDAVFPLTAVVRRRSAQPLGIGIEFIGLDDRRRRQFFEFIHAPLPAAAADELEVMEGD